MTEIFPINETQIGTGIVGFLQYINSITQGALGLIIVVMVGLVSFLASKSGDSSDSFVYSTFFMMIVAVLLRFLSLINNYVLGAVLALFIVAMWMLFTKER
jgi:hypothetical protein